MLCHGFTDREERLLQTDQKQRQSQQDVDKTHRNTLEVGHSAAQHRKLEKDQNDDDGRHIEGGAERRPNKLRQDFHQIAIP